MHLEHESPLISGIGLPSSWVRVSNADTSFKEAIMSSEAVGAMY